MLRRPIVAVVLCTLAGCQDYNFNPVGKCIIQPGSQRILISSVSTADVLFVVDDSGSMDPMQANLSRNFDAFITSLAQAQADRKSQSLDPFEFHIAITTSSIFQDFKGGQACSGGVCSIGAVTGVHGAYSYACANAGDLCGDYMTVFSGIPDPTCTLGTAAGNNTPYPQGDFVALGANPKVLHFTKDLKWETWGTASVDAQLQQRVDQFKQNVLVGSCGSGQEQHFEAGRLAVKKALRTNGLQQPADVTPADWPHTGAKMVVVWLGNEDDCSNPPTVTAPGANLVPASLVVDGSPGADTCLTAEAPASTPVVDTPGKLFPLDDYVSYFTGLGRPFGAAFVYSAVPDATSVGGFKGGICPAGCTLPAPGVAGTCIGDSAGTRFQQLAAGFRLKGIGTVEGTICDAEFAKTLQNIANLVVPVNALSLPTQPAESDVAVLRIEAADGTTRKFCTGPGPTLDWNFVSCDGKATPADPGTTTACMTINHATKNCEANPGETYVAQYLGLVPQPSQAFPLGGCLAANDCTAALGGADKDWSCIVKVTGSRGTCVCQ